MHYKNNIYKTLFFFLLSCQSLIAQDINLLNYQFNKLIDNPAMISDTNYLPYSFVYKENSLVPNEDKFSTFALSLIFHLNKNKAKKIKSSVALLALYDDLPDLFHTYDISANYALRIPLSERSALTFGARLGFLSVGLDELIFENQTRTGFIDRSLSSGEGNIDQNFNHLNLSTGLGLSHFLQDRKLRYIRLGFALQNVYGQTIFGANLPNIYAWQYSILAETQIELSNKLFLQPYTRLIHRSRFTLIRPGLRLSFMPNGEQRLYSDTSTLTIPELWLGIGGDFQEQFESELSDLPSGSQNLIVSAGAKIDFGRWPANFSVAYVPPMNKTFRRDQGFEITLSIGIPRKKTLKPSIPVKIEIIPLPKDLIESFSKQDDLERLHKDIDMEYQNVSDEKLGLTTVSRYPLKPYPDEQTPPFTLNGVGNYDYDPRELEKVGNYLLYKTDLSKEIIFIGYSLTKTELQRAITRLARHINVRNVEYAHFVIQTETATDIDMKKIFIFYGYDENEEKMKAFFNELFEIGNWYIE